MKFQTNKKKNKNSLKIISLGGFGYVTQNLFVYEYKNSLLLVDCGVGFPSANQPGGDLIIPDPSYLEKNRDKIRGIVITHGHEDHMGGLPFILPRLGKKIPVYASRLATALIREKLAEHKVSALLNEITPDQKLNLGDFTVEFVYVTHSVPDSYNLIINTPLGTILHASDFKFDWTPVVGSQTEVGKIALAGNKGVLLLLSDCLRSEKPGYTLSEVMVGESLEREINHCRGKFLVTTISSNISRWHQAIEVIHRHQRKVAFVGRSVERMMRIASQLGYLKLPKDIVIKTKQVSQLPPEKVGLLVAGSQGQSGSALTRIAAGESDIKVKPGDKVVFSADYIPGNEVAIHRLIDNFSRRGADVSYSEILDDLHVSGHAAQRDLSLMLALARPKFALPIGGAFRQMKQYSLLAQEMGYREEEVLLPDKNETIEILPGGQVKLGRTMSLRTKLVDSRVKR